MSVVWYAEENLKKPPSFANRVVSLNDDGKITVEDLFAASDLEAELLFFKKAGGAA
jgi:hypothetical protein